MAAMTEYDKRRIEIMIILKLVMKHWIVEALEVCSGWDMNRLSQRVKGKGNNGSSFLSTNNAKTRLNQTYRESTKMGPSFL